MILVDKETGQEYEADPGFSVSYGEKKFWYIARINTGKPVDLSVLADSGVFCQFNNNPGLEKWVGYCPAKYDAREMHPFHFGEGDGYFYIKPLMDYWFSTLNFEEADETNEFLLSLEKAGFEFDAHSEGFKITGLKNGYSWPWECSE